ncbi:DUF362 domain-containing protein [Alkaliphilus serpentinus]|uniref:DUF362 domain-containing protein n=1 Tax=Alkaliphilus serpentinus TaxID=1482731 RepID=A0A833HNV4_9FIRM|nr:DUF362 domain-containing protein [Alkaliphilus serpentinus]KAB3529158.1 DUF362 domain-containing protein [Alkaliphilus serpentinus]
MRNRRVIEPLVSIARSGIEERSLVDALNLLPMNRLIRDGDTVVITPNWVKAMAPNTATVVGPKTLKELITFVKGKNPKRIVIACGSGGDDTLKVFREIGYERVITSEGVDFIDLNYGPYTDLNLDHSIIKTTKVNGIIKEADVLISFSQLKVHEEATISGTIKNVALSWPPAEIHGFPKKKLGIHEDLHGFIVAMTKKVPIDLAILSVDKAMIGTGPSDGKAINTEGLVIASTDAIAADAIGGRLLGFLPQAISYLYALYREGIGEADPRKMKMTGLTLEEAERIFSMAAYGQEVLLDKNNNIKDLHGTLPN